MEVVIAAGSLAQVARRSGRAPTPAFAAIALVAQRLPQPFGQADRSGCDGDARPDHQRTGIFRKGRAACNSGAGLLKAIAGRPLLFGLLVYREGCIYSLDAARSVTLVSSSAMTLGLLPANPDTADEFFPEIYVPVFRTEF